jgi:hypothetical protein
MIVVESPGPTISLDKEPPGCLERPAAMAYALLLRVRELGESATERRIEEERIVSEAAGPTRRLRDHALDDALDDLLGFSWAGQGNRAAEARGPPRRSHITEPLEQERPSVRIREPGAPEPGRVQPRRATQGVDLEARIVAQRQRARELGRGASLSESIFRVGLPCFFRQAGAGEVREEPDPERHIAQERLELASLARIERGEDKNRRR